MAIRKKPASQTLHYEPSASRYSQPVPLKSSPSWKIKLLFWIILGTFSAIFAEVITASKLFPVFSATGLLIIIPVYLTHIVVLGTIAFRWGKPTLQVLYPAGMLFGLYEAYLTKVLWLSYPNSTNYGDPPFTLGGVAIFEFLLLVFFWHAIMAFILPLLFVEHALTGSREIEESTPPRLVAFLKKKWLLYLIFGTILLGWLQSNNIPDPTYALAAGLLNGLVIVILLGLWRYATRGTTYRMHDLFPARKGFIIWCIILVLFYAGAIIFGQETMPALSSQVTIWIVYAIAILLLIRGIQKSRERNIHETTHTPSISLKAIGAVTLLFTAASLIGVMWLPTNFKLAIAFTVWVIGIGTGVGLFIYALKSFPSRHS